MRIVLDEMAGDWRLSPGGLFENAIESDVAGRANRLEPARLPCGDVVDFRAGVASERDSRLLGGDRQSESQNPEDYQYAVQAK